MSISLFSMSVSPLLLLLSHFSRVRLSATPWTAAHQASLSMGFSRQEYWSGVPLPSPALLVRMTKKINREQQRPHLLKEACHPYIVGYIVVWPSLENLICHRSEWQGGGVRNMKVKEENMPGKGPKWQVTWIFESQLKAKSNKIKWIRERIVQERSGR